LVNVLISQGYWEPYQVWVPSGYWTEPLHGKVSISKAPAYAFTKWHWLTEDGQWHNDQDEPAHLDFTISWQTDKAVKSIEADTVVHRYDRHASVDHTNLTSMALSPPSAQGEIKTVGRYEHAGMGIHRFILAATDGSKCVITCEIPINGFKSLNSNEMFGIVPNSTFLRSVQDVGCVSF
jgi:hypothetical protein